MANEQSQQQNQQQSQQPNQQQNPQPEQQDAQAAAGQQSERAGDAIDGLKDKKPEDLTPEELRLMADTMPGEGPGD